MSARRTLIRSTGPLLRNGPCLLCQSRLFTRPSQRNGSAKATGSFKWGGQAPMDRMWRVNYSTGKMSPQQVRVEVDKRARKGFYTMMQKEGIIVMDSTTADDIYTNFVALSKNKMDQAAAVSELAQKYKLKIADITSLAIATFRIPDISDPNRKLPPSQHKPMSGLLLQGCARAKDPLALLHILSAVYLSNLGTLPAAKDIARLFSPNEKSHYAKLLEELASEGNVEAMTLQGQFLEREGKKQQAKALYEKALEKSTFNFDTQDAHAMSLPKMTPWNALGFLLKAEKDPRAAALAKQAFEKGALKGDDPLAYFELAAYEKKMSPDWLKYTTKAASTGHREAMYNLGNFYMELNSDAPTFMKDGKMRKALNWVTAWKPGSAAAHAQEWFQLAANADHKPSMLELAEFSRIEGDIDKAREYWKRIVESSSTDSTEEWPQLVKQAKERLVNVRA